MKLLKIYFSVLLFSFLGSVQNQVLAQAEPTRNAGYWERTLNVTDYLENGEFRAKLKNHPTNEHWAQLIIYKKSDNSVVKSILVHNDTKKTAVKSLQLDTSGGDPNIWLTCTSEAQTVKVLNLSTAGRVSPTWFHAASILDTTTEVTSYAYFQLENDGRFIIYHSTGMFNSPGNPIVELNGDGF
jgi:hypothetical protein